MRHNHPLSPSQIGLLGLVKNFEMVFETFDSYGHVNNNLLCISQNLLQRLFAVVHPHQLLLHQTLPYQTLLHPIPLLPHLIHLIMWTMKSLRRRRLKSKLKKRKKELMNQMPMTALLSILWDRCQLCSIKLKEKEKSNLNKVGNQILYCIVLFLL